MALTAAGLVAGCSGTTSSSPAAALAPKGAGSTAASQAAPATPTSLSPAASPVTSPAISPSATSSPVPASTVGNGTLEGTYSVQLTEPYSAPLGATAPTQAQIAAGAACDVYYNGQLTSCNSEKIVSLPNGSTPSYSACTASTLFVDSASANQGTAFCIIETSGRVAGISVAAAGNTPSYYVTLKVSVWQYVVPSS
ncbi:MAG TPA: hypothetical protein VKU77_10715 [Streptosporangiaceae bacterium]|nr:hypothetical protein [Streptosporangiaceae bacterium]